MIKKIDLIILILENTFNYTTLREREHLIEIFKIQVDDIILPWVADCVPMYWWVPIS